MKNKTFAWSVFDHTNQFKDSMVGYHCPNCGMFYTYGYYTIEGKCTENGKKYILTLNKSQNCCGIDVFTPIVFFDSKKATSFLENIAKQWRNVEAIRKSRLIEAHFKNKREVHN